MRKIKVVKKLTDKGFPVHTKGYKSAHRKADAVEKKSDPIAYKKVNKLERKLGKHELMGKNLKSGEIEIEKKFAKNKRIKRNIIKHEISENKTLRKK